MISQLRYGTSTSQYFWGYDETSTGGVLGVKIDGGSIVTGDTLAAATNYMGTVQVTGLTAGTHNYQMTLGGVDVGPLKTFSTAPASTDDMKVAIWGCSAHVNNSNPFATGDNPAFNEMLENNIDCHISLGDFYYLAPTYSMYDVSAITAASTYAAELPKYNGMYRYHAEMSLARQKVMEKYPFVGMWDNHEIYSTALDSEVGALSAGGTTSVKDAAAEAAWYAFLKGRPASTGLDTVPAIAGGPLYTKWQWGNVEFIMLDRVSHCGTTIYQLGTNQVNWCTAAIAASTAEFIVIVSPSVFRSSPLDYQTIMTAADAVSKTVLVVCSDFHYNDARFIQGTYMPLRGMMQFLFNPINQVIGSYSDTLSGNSTQRFQEAAPTTELSQSFCLLETQGTDLTVSCISTYRGKVRAKFTLSSGDRDALNEV